MPQEPHSPSTTDKSPGGFARRPLTPAHAYRTAISLHRQGRLREAEQVYRAVLRIAPDHAGALHQLGNLCRQRGEFEEAVSLIERALAIDPQSARRHNDLGIVLSALRRPGEAAEHYAKAVALEPGFTDAHNNLGNALRSLGREEEAIASFERALELHPNFAEAHNNLGNALAAVQRPAEAIAHYEQAVAIKPELAQAYYNHGLALTSLGRPAQALVQFEKAVAANPEYSDAHAAIGKTLLRLNRPAEATARLEQALSAVPDSPEAHHGLASALAALNRRDEAIAHYRQAIESKPNFAEAHNNLGNLLAASNRHDEAVAHFRTALTINPMAYEAYNNLGSALLKVQRPQEALACFERALALRPGLAEPTHNIGIALAALDRNEEALGFYRSVLASNPELAAAHANLGNALVELSRPEEGIVSYEAALARDPGMASAHQGLGLAYVALGRFAEAHRSFERAIEMQPRRADFYRSFADSRRFAPGDAYLAAMEEMAGAMESFSTDQQIELHFGLAKAYSDLQQHDRAFRHLLEGNALKRRQLDYDEPVMLGRLQRSKTVFSRELIERMRGGGESSEVPVFIVGMPRSGTTLIEQILASHPQVFAAGEVMDLPRAAGSVCEPPGATVPYPEMVPSMTADRFKAVGTAYLQRLTARAPTAFRITDKLPGNFRLLGLIHLALPNARIIHVRRDPIDTCLSCFSRLFTGLQPFAYDLGELGRFYRAYESLMAHWRAVLPAGVMLEVQYEDLVADFAPQARRIVAYCGLEWDERCAAFHETQRPVRTASATQVRQPLYRSAVGRAQPYAAMLGPLIEALRSEDGGQRAEDKTS
jgi:tetratricopeptide (TPR) repeat protein